MNDADAVLWAVLRAVLEQIGGGRDERAVFEALVRETAGRLGYEWVSVVLGEPYERTPRILLSVPTAPRGFWSGQRVGPRSGVLEAIETGVVFVREAREATEIPLWEDPALDDLGIVTYAAIPLSGEGRVVGTFNVGAARAGRVRGELARLECLASFAAAAAVPARLVAEVQRRLPRLAEKASAPVPPDF
jgi:GAF domain-containing protein